MSIQATSPTQPLPDQPPPAIPPPLPALSYEDFRRHLAGLSDPDRRPESAGEKGAVKETARRLCSIFAKLFGDDLNRMTLWGRIGSALETACAKVSDDDLDRWCDLCLEHVQADPAEAARCDALTAVRLSWETWPRELRFALLSYIRSHRYAVLTFGRQRWEQALEEAKARKAAGGSGEVEL